MTLIPSNQRVEPLVANRVIRFTVHGVARPAGSKKAFGYVGKDGKQHVAVSDANPKSKPWKDIVGWTARQAYAGPLLTGPLAVQFTFHLVRPKGHFGKGRNASAVKASAPPYPTGPPDVLKLARGIEDALSSVVYRDDAQIVDERLVKIYGDTAKVEVEIVVREHPRPVLQSAEARLAR